MQLAMCDAIRIAYPQIASDAKKFFFTSDAKTHLLDLKSQENARKTACENPAMLACDAKIGVFFKIERCGLACDSDSRCGLACDASAHDAKSLAMWVERCEPLSINHTQHNLSLRQCKLAPSKCEWIGLLYLWLTIFLTVSLCYLR